MELYANNERAGGDVDRKLELRRTESGPVLEKLKTWLWSQAVVKTLSIGKAAAYVIASWPRLMVFSRMSSCRSTTTQQNAAFEVPS